MPGEIPGPWRGQPFRYRLAVEPDGSNVSRRVWEWAGGNLRRENLLTNYFALGSVDAVMAYYMKKNPPYGLPISEADYHRQLDREGVVKSAGRHADLAYGLLVLEMLHSSGLKRVESFYRDHVPPTIKEVISQSGLWRMVNAVKEREGAAWRYGTALVITPERDPGRILVARDMVVNRPELGKPGDWTVPMTYARNKENADMKVRRVMQEEVRTQQVIQGQFPGDLSQFRPALMGIIKVADVKTEVYHLNWPSGESDFSSFKLADY